MLLAPILTYFIELITTISIHISFDKNQNNFKQQFFYKKHSAIEAHEIQGFMARRHYVKIPARSINSQNKNISIKKFALYICFLHTEAILENILRAP